MKNNKTSNYKLYNEIEKYNKEMTENEKLRKKLKRDYVQTRQNNISNFINYSYDEKKVIDIDLNDKGIVKTENLTYEIDNFEKIRQYIKISTRKLLRYAISRMNENTFISNFTLSEYAKICNKDKSYLSKKIKGKKNKNGTTIIPGDLELLRMITNVKCNDTKQGIYEFISIVTATKYEDNTGKITVEFYREFAKSLKYFMYLPKKIFKIDDKKYPHAYNMICYFFEKARIDKSNLLHLKINSILERTGLPKKDKVNKRYNQLIIEPFLNSLDYLSSNFDIRITPDEDYKNINDFLEGYITIEIYNDYVKSYINKIKRKELKQNIDKNTKNKASRKENTLKLLKEGKTEKEIAEIFHLNFRTIKNYIKELKLENKI
jgi:hypothetical protein